MRDNKSLKINEIELFIVLLFEINSFFRFTNSCTITLRSLKFDSVNISHWKIALGSLKLNIDEVSLCL